MAGFNPLAAAAADGTLSQSSLAAIDLGVAIEILQAQLALGDLLTATVLPPQGGSDRLLLLGQTVLAQLPPGIDPGESLLLQVTGFAGNQIVVRNLGVVDPNDPPPTANVELPPPAPGAPLQATLTTVVTPPSPASTALPAAAAPGLATAGARALAQPISQPQAPSAGPPSAPAQPAAAAAPGSVAPPRSVFVAASVQPAPVAPAGQSLPPTPPTTVSALAEAVAAGAEAEIESLGLEARIVATRTVSLDIAELVNTPAKPSQNAPPPQSPAGVASSIPAASQRPALPVQVAQTPPPAARTIERPQEPASPEEALLARVRVPATPLTLAAARIAANAATALPRALARLDAALAGVVSQDGRAGSLRALIAFVGKMDAGNARALPEQIMAFVNNAVDGAEAKIAAIVRQFLQSAPEEPPEEAPVAAGAQPQAPVVPNVAVPPNLPTAPALPEQPAAPVLANAALEPEAAAHVAERITALQYDLKATIVALSESPPAGAPPELAPALTDALTALTAMQLNVLGAQSANPSAITIPLPLFFHENGRPVQLRISREAPRGGKLDADNFHIAFVLDTKSLGTVAVDMQTVGRLVSVNVKTETSPAASRFRDTLDDLRGRLEQLHYRIASIAAAVAPHRFTPPPAEPAIVADELRKSVLGLDARA